MTELGTKGKTVTDGIEDLGVVRIEPPATSSDLNELEMRLSKQHWEFKKRTQENEARILTSMKEKEKMEALKDRMWKERLAFISTIVGLVCFLIGLAVL